MPFKNIRIVTDSTCDIPRDLIEQYKIGVVPCFVNYGGNSYADDGVQLIREDFYRDIPHIRPVPKTSAFPPGMVETLLEATFQEAEHVVILCVPAKLSGVYNAFRLGASNFPKEKVTLIDSGQVAMALGWQVLIAAETAAATGDLQQVLDAIQRVRANQRLYAALDTLEYLRHSGRVGWASASIGTLLQIKPILDVQEGEVKSYARVRTFKRAFDELVHLTREQAPLDRLAILHTANEQGAQDLKDALQDVVPDTVFVVNINPTIGTHIGPGGLGVATLSQSWKA
ncbi:MAG: DegV family protein [Anaerolineae bacterium]|nr:DegV family protein [Anaerolineae bacterium]